MPISPEAKYVRLHPRNVELLRGNVTAAYLMQFFIDQCAPKPGTEPFEFKPVELTVNQIRDLTGVGWERIRTATTILIDRGFLEKTGNYANSNAPATYCPLINGNSR